VKQNPAPRIKQSPAEAEKGEALPRLKKDSFPVVGIGASAGGLEALEKFLGRVPEKSGMAFVIIQHMDPTHKGIMVEILQRVTPMKVIQAGDGTRVRPDSVYVIPPNKDMSILHGTLRLFDPVTPRGLRLPIDLFFRSLAEDRQQGGIAVILSGMGSDGTVGIRAIKEKAGIVLVQEPASAKFDGMPRSAINTGLADFVAPVEQLPGKIIAYLSHKPVVKADLPLEDAARSSLEKIFILLRSQTGHDFSLYKKNTLYRRIERRMGIHQIDKITAYVRYLQENPQEREFLSKELLIGVTNFFRDPSAWEQLRKEVIPALLSDRSARHALRAWVPGCSTGEEAYSLAIVFREAMDKVQPAQRTTLQIFATDLDREAIDRARQGSFPANIAADISQERLDRFFIKTENGYQICKEIRETAIFATQNVIMDPPFTKLDIISCRNVLIYLTPEAQRKLIPIFHYSLNPGGFLFLGSSETIGASTGLFSSLPGKSRLYRRVESTLRTQTVEFPPSFVSLLPSIPEEREIPGAIVNLQALADRILLQYSSPPAVLINDKGDILYINGRTGKYVEPAAGKANWNIFAMAREGLRCELTNAFQKAVRQRDPVTLRGLKVGPKGGKESVAVTVRPIEEPEALRGSFLVVFTDEVPLPATKSQERSPVDSATQLELENELKQAREDLQSTREEMQTSQEELKSANEELQSTNEELTTSKEEMQSMNEELQTVNTELQAKIDELSHLNNDMMNLLNSTDIATVFVDNALNVRRFTIQATKLFKLIGSDIGRPITDLATDLDYPEMSKDAKEVLRTLVFVEKEIPTHDGRWFAARIMPYRTLENMIDGVVITLTDITTAKTLEARLRETLAEQGSGKR
jgi:two-component system, chemotaxis family, CheB/CheR fusion protein